MATFPKTEWIQALMAKLNSDQKYAKVAAKWEGDMAFKIEPSSALAEGTCFYLDLWHGKCRDAYVLSDESDVKASFTLHAPYENYKRLLQGELDPIQALLTRKIGVQGNMAVIMRSVPTVLDFVRCCREVTDGFV